jgi:hypothetical protein
VHVDAVNAAIEGDDRLVQSSLRRQEHDLARRDVGRVYHEDVDPPAETRGQRVVEVTLVDVSADGGDVLARARDGRVLDV